MKTVYGESPSCLQLRQRLSEPPSRVSTGRESSDNQDAKSPLTESALFSLQLRKGTRKPLQSESPSQRRKACASILLKIGTL